MPLVTALAVLTQKCRDEGDPGNSSKKSPAKNIDETPPRSLKGLRKKHPEQRNLPKKWARIPAQNVGRRRAQRSQRLH